MKNFNLWETAQEKIIVVAHRGVFGGNIPCNTIASYDIALKQGADMLEVDVEMSRDGKLYINGHNYPESISWKQQNSDGTVTKTEFNGFIDGKEPYVTVTLTEENTGLTYTFNVRTVGSVSEVILDSNEIIF